MPDSLIKGIHHVTALARNAQHNVDFYTGILGLRLVKKTVNFDATNVYHVYFGNEIGSPGSIMTFFPYRNIRTGSHGTGQVATTTFSIPKDAIDYWIKRFEHFDIEHKPPQMRFDEIAIYFEDWDGLGLELIANDQDERPAFSYGQIPIEHAVRGFYSVEIWEYNYEKTESVLVNLLNHLFIKESSTRRRYSTLQSGKPGSIVDIMWDAQKRPGIGGGGTVHHIAFETPSGEDQLAVREKILSAGLHPTKVLDRQYFQSIYFREPGGVLFEVATSDPGFVIDEQKENLGSSLKLPPWEEQHRKRIEEHLDSIQLNPEKYVSPS